MRGFDRDVIRHALELRALHRNPAIIRPRQDEIVEAIGSSVRSPAMIPTG